MSENSNSMQKISRQGSLENVLTKEQLEHDFFVLGLTQRQVAEKYNCGVGAVSKYQKKYSILSEFKWKSPKVRQLLLQKVELSTIQKSIVVGSLLGDGHVHKSGHVQSRNANFTCSQCADRKAYLEWKYENMLPFSRPIYEMKKEKAYMFDTVCYEAFNIYHDLFFKDTIKIIPGNIVSLLDDLALAIWYQDDGSIGRYSVNNSSFATCSFTIDECNFLLSVLEEKFGMKDGRLVYSEYKPTPYYPLLCFTGKGHFRLHEIVDPLLHTCFEYKKLPENRASETISKAPLIEG